MVEQQQGTQEAEMSGDKVLFWRDNQKVFLSPEGMDSEAAAPSAPQRLRLVRIMLAFMTVSFVFSLVALFVVALQGPRPAPEDHASFQPFSGDKAVGQLPVESYKLPETLQMFECRMENSSSWSTAIQMLTCRVDNISSQIQMLSGHLENTSADVQVTKGCLKNASDLSVQTQMLRSSLDGANVEIQKLKGDVDKVNALNSQTQSFLRNSSENTSAEIQLLRGRLESAGDESHSFKRDLETITTQTRIANSRLDQTEAQIHVLKTELKDMNASHSQMWVLTDRLENANREIQALQRGMKDAATLKSKTEMLESNLQTASSEIQRLKRSAENTTALTIKIRETQNHLDTLRASLTSQEQLQRSQSQLLELILQGWSIYNGNLYYFSQTKKPWAEAEQYCVSHGAHLASVTSMEEQEFLVKFTKNSYHWIGLTDSGTEGSWRWVDGTPFSDTQSKAFWDRNQPDNWEKGGKTEDCGQVQQTWNDNFCDSLYQWVCKKSGSQDKAGQS